MNVQTIGPHRLVVGDIHYGSIDLVMGGEKADLIYSDPPWGPGLLQMFATMNVRGSAPVVGWSTFLATFCAACAEHRTPTAPVFVEMGLRWVDELDAHMAQRGLDLRRRWTATYGSKRLPFALSLYGGTDLDADAVVLPDPPHGEAVTRAVLETLVCPGTVVLDPCTGLGMTARITHKLGGHFRGTELNPKRMEVTAKWLRSRSA